MNEEIEVSGEGGSLDNIGSETEDGLATSTRSSRMGLGGAISVGGRCSYAGMDEDTEDILDDDCYREGGGSRRRRKADDDDAPFEGNSYLF